MAVEGSGTWGAAKDGGTRSTSSRDRRRVMTTFYDVEIGALETQELRIKPVPFWLVSFSDSIKGPVRQPYLLCRAFARWEDY
jgi:hypothetical protein